MKPENSPPDGASPSSSPPDAGPQPCACCGCTCCGDAPRRESELVPIDWTQEEFEYLVRGSMRIVYF